MTANRPIVQIRTKKLGLLIMDARAAQRRSVEECAQALGIEPEAYLAFEKGQSAPSLPQIEMLALFLNVPLEHFWGKQALSSSELPQDVADKQRLQQLRSRMIGANLRLARNNVNFSYAELTARTGISEDQLKRYEIGETAVPLPELEVLAQVFDIPIERFFDQHGPIGRVRSRQAATQQFLDLPPEIQAFVCKPVNRPYLELAMRLSDLSAEKLRAVAETLLEITY